MLGSAVIDVIIGLVFVYILLSLLVAQVNQIVANLLNLRAQQLRVRVEGIIYDADLQERVLSHPVVGITRPPTTVKETTQRARRTTPVTTLSSTNFAKAMINILSDPFLDVYAALTLVEDEAERQRLRDIVDQLKVNLNSPERANAVLNQFHSRITALEPANRPDRRALLRTLSPLQTSIREFQSGNSALLQIYNSVSQVENRAFQQAMETVLSGVQTVNEAEAAIEEWFDNKMAQTKDLYARTMQYLSLVVGLVIALVLNIDSLYLAETLWNDSALRDRLTVAATSAAFGNDSFVIQEQVPAEGTEQTPEQAVDAVVDSFQLAEATFQELLELRLPIGWTFRPPGTNIASNVVGAESVNIYDPLTDKRNLYNLIPFVTGNWFLNLLIKIVGLLVTSFAVAQGAPFWFDVLRRISGNKNTSSTPSGGSGTQVE